MSKADNELLKATLESEVNEGRFGRFAPVHRLNDGSVHVDQTIFRAVNVEDEFSLVRVEIWPVEPERAQELLTLLGNEARKWLDENAGTEVGNWSSEQHHLN